MGWQEHRLISLNPSIIALTDLSSQEGKIRNAALGIFKCCTRSEWSTQRLDGGTRRYRRIQIGPIHCQSRSRNRAEIPNPARSVRIIFSANTFRFLSPFREMFKRVEKRLAKKREEEELGITEEIKEAVGLNGLDSDDSTSDESEASSSSSTPQVPSKRKRPFEEELDDGSDSAFGGCSSSASADEFDEDEPDVQMTVEEVLHNPLFITSIQPDIRGCVVCPRKVLKNDTMVSVHTMSQVSPKVPRVTAEVSLHFPLRSAGPSATNVQVQGSGCICETR